MTVQELITRLQQEDPDAPVHFAYGAGDHWRTVVTPVVCKVEAGIVAYSDYHGKPVLADEDEEPEHANEVVVLFA
jgi:hypothetical protein